MNIYEKWCKQLGIEPLPKLDKPITEHPDVQKLIILYSQLQTKYDTLLASHTKLVEELQEIIGDYQESPHSFTVPDIHERIEQAITEAEKIK